MCRTDGSESEINTLAVEYNTCDLGMMYEWPGDITLGFMFKNIYGYPRKKEYDVFTLPKYVTIGASIKKHSYLYTIDCENIFGNFDGLKKKTVEFIMVRGGVEKTILTHYSLRLGVLIPVVARTSTLGDIRKKMPNPKIGGTVGGGASFRYLDIDAAVYGDPARSYIEEAIRLSGVFTITLKY